MVTAILAVISTVIVSTLSAGIRVWKSVQGRIEEKEFLFAWKQLQRDLRNQVRFDRLQFVGETESFFFPHLVPFRDEKSGKTFQEIGRVRYSFDPEQQSLCREILSYRDLQKSKSALCTPLIAGLSGASFEYFGSSKVNGKASGEETEFIAWHNTWEGNTAPAMVRLHLFFVKKNEKTLTILLPLGE